MKTQSRILLTAVVFVSLSFFCPVSGQAPAAKPPAPAATVEKTAGEAMKNVQVLKDIPESEWNKVMAFVSGSLGVSCDHCHAQPFDSDTKKPKQTARAMMKMVREINAANFNGQPVVTCNTCHRGSLEPKAMPSIWSKTPEELAAFKKQMEADRVPATSQPAVAKPGPAPAADEAFAKYRKAIGAGPVSSIHLSGTVASDLRQPVSLEVHAVFPDKFLVHNSVPGGADFLTIANGDQGWTIGPQGTRELSHSGIEGLKDNFNKLLEPVKFAEAGASGKVTGTEKVLGRACTVVELETSRELDRLYFDAESGLLYKARIENRVPGFGVTPTEVFYEDYRDVNGVKFPFSITSISTVDHARLKLSEIQTNIALDPSKFEPPPKPAASK
jgi:hypothetical protein